MKTKHRVPLLILLASVLNVLMWVMLNDDFREKIVNNADYYRSSDFLRDCGIFLFESGFLTITGILLGRAILKTLSKSDKVNFPMVMTILLFALLTLSMLLSYIFWDVLNYYNNEEFWDSSIILWSLSYLFTLIVLSVDLLKWVRTSDRAKAEASREAAAAQRELRLSELEKFNVHAGNHFLYNCMSMIYTEIANDPKEAGRSMESLLSISKYLSKNASLAMVGLSEEMDFVESYLNLIGKRYPYVSVLFTNPPDEYSGYVVPMSVQSLIENAIKHNTHNSNNPLDVTVVIEESKITVRNKLQPRISPQPTSGQGLKLLISRYQRLTDEKVIIDAGKDGFSVTIPVINDSNMRF